MTALINLDVVNCKLDPQEPLFCPTEGDGLDRPVSNDGLYPRGFYYLLSWAVGNFGDLNVFLTRATSTFVICGTLCLMMVLLPTRHRLVLTLMMLTIFTSTGFYLFASINPSSWSMVGVGAGWLPLHAALNSKNISFKSRSVLLGFGSLVSAMAAISRWDALPYIAVMIALLSVHSAMTLFPGRQRRIWSISLILPLVLWATLEVFTPLSPVYYLKTMTTFTDGQPDNVMFLSTNFLQGFASTLRGLGYIPAMTQVDIPGVVLIASFASLGVFIAASLNRRQVLQFTGLLIGVVALGLVSAAQIAKTDVRDVGNLEPRYGLPLTAAIIGWWYLMGPEDLHTHVRKYLKLGEVVAVGSFALVVFTVAERFVDRQTYSFRLLPEGPDQWWWSWMPVGPNVPMILSPIFFWFFIRTITDDALFTETVAD